MCGFSFIIKINNSYPLEKNLKKMNSKIFHRGPDSHDYFIENNVGMGHRRLSIIDLSSNANQPMDYLGLYKIVYNGEIYNYLEIKRQLIELGYDFKTKSDTEVILVAYHKWGEKCVKRFNGMWSFVIYDRSKKIVFASRDRFGIKPFYYYENKDGLFFSSEIKQILVLENKWMAEMSTVLDYLVLDKSEHSEKTFFKNIFKLNPGHNLIFDLKKRKKNIYKYYELKVKKKYSKLDLRQTNLFLDTLLKQSIDYRLRSDVKVGSCLSGGIDSSIICSIASEKYTSKNKFTALTAQSGSKTNDETEYAKMVVEKLDLDWYKILLDEKEFLISLDDVINTQEEPFRSPSVILQYFLMKIAKKTNCKVLLDGQGGDETFLGYERYYISYLNSLSFFDKLIACKDIITNSKLNFFSLTTYFFYFNFSFLRKYFLKRRFRFLRNNMMNKINWNLISEFNLNFKETSEVQISEITKFNIPELLRYEDKNSMAHSIETRVPFLDHNLIEFAVSIPDKFKIRDGWTKFLLRNKLQKKVNNEISWRKNKIGFEPPMEKWMKNTSLFHETIHSSPFLKKIIKKNELISDKNILWKLYNLSVWSKKFKIIE